MTITRVFIFVFLLIAAVVIGQTPLPPTAVAAVGYEQHILLSWQGSTSSGVTGYQIFRSTDGIDFTLLKSTGSGVRAVSDWTGDEGPNLNRWYKIKTVGMAGQTSDFSVVTNATTHPMTDEELMEMVQKQTFRYFWDHGHPASGMARERDNSGNTVTTGGTGFGIMSVVVAAERGWITRDAAVNRLLQIASFLQVADRFHGAFPHWMDGNTGNVVAFSQYDDGADLVETAFLIQGLLTARAYFDQNTPLEGALRDVVTGLWEDVEWDWFRKNNSNVLYWHWSPNFGWQMNFALRGFFEAQIVYILAAASPTHAVPGSLYQTGWTASGYANNSIHYGHKVYCGPFGGGPMFFAHYSYLGFDPRFVKDNFCNYFVRNRNHALIQHAHAISNPENHTGYSTDCWGLTACDKQNGYAAHDIHPGNDDGTIAPTAALASMPYTPEESMRALKHFYRVQGEKLWGEFGFFDAFNLNQNWFATSTLAIDQGPIIVMIENHRTGLLWENFMKNPEIQPALTAVGLVPDSISVSVSSLQKPDFEVQVYPNPGAAGSAITIEITSLEHHVFSATLTDESGRTVKNLMQNRVISGVSHRSTLPAGQIGQGIYFLRVTNEKGQEITRPVIVQEY